MFTHCCEAFAKLVKHEYIVPAGSDVPDNLFDLAKLEWRGHWAVEATSDDYWDDHREQFTMVYCPKCGKKLEKPN